MSFGLHFQTDGQINWFNRMMKEYLRRYMTVSQKNWMNLLDAVWICFNIQRSSSSTKSPFEVVTIQRAMLPHTLAIPNVWRCPRAYNFSKHWGQNTGIGQAYLEKTS